MERVSKINYYLDIAQTVSERSTCLRKHFGAIIVKNDSIVSTGYNGAPRGRKNCNDISFCLRDHLQIPRGERYELCRSIHAEANADNRRFPRKYARRRSLYVLHRSENRRNRPHTCSCMMCKRQIINAGIERVFVRENAEEYSVYNVADWVTDDDSLSGKFGY